MRGRRLSNVSLLVFQIKTKLSMEFTNIGVGGIDKGAG